jgi:hypothetical protein
MPNGISHNVTLTDIVKDWLDNRGWAFELEVDEDNHSCRFSTSVQVASQNYRVYIDVDEDDEQVAVLFYAPFIVPTDCVAEMVVLLNWINDAANVGRLVVPMSDEATPVQWKAVLDVEGSELSAKQVGTLISAGAATFESYEGTISSVALKKTTVEEAIRRWEEGRASEAEG